MEVRGFYTTKPGGSVPVKFFTKTAGISKALLSPLTKIGLPQYEWIDDPSQADYFVFGVNYEVAHDPTFFKPDVAKELTADIPHILAYESELIALAKRYDKKLIVVYYNDDASPIPINNAIIFRTSILKSKSNSMEHCIPVLKNDLSLLEPVGSEWLPWMERPSIGFRGQAIAGKIKASRILRNQINLLANRLGGKDLFSIHKNYGYLVRKNAMDYLSKSSLPDTDFYISTQTDVDDAIAKNLYVENVFRNPYTLCVSGFGNYSYRLYETLSAGRIPVFIDTDCKLPFEEFIDWKQQLVWVDRKELHRIDRIIMDFHQAHKGDAFIELQQKNKQLWKERLAPKAFFSSLVVYL